MSKKDKLKMQYKINPALLVLGGAVIGVLSFMPEMTVGSVRGTYQQRYSREAFLTLHKGVVEPPG